MWWGWKTYHITVGMVFGWAFLSYLHQQDGLLSPYSPTPVSPPQLLNLSGEDTLTLAGLIGLTTSILAIFHSPAWILPSTAAYALLVRSSGLFFSFQWDILLLECGWITGVMAVGGPPALPLARSLLSAVGIKLMFSSGAAKIGSAGWSWLQLRALSFHFATQCIPTPLAPYMASLPIEVLAAGTAGTFLLQVWTPVVWALLLPDTSAFPIVWLVSLAHMAFQLLIAATGNYTFFNLLAAALSAVPLLATGRSRSRFGLPPGLTSAVSFALGAVLVMAIPFWFSASPDEGIHFRLSHPAIMVHIFTLCAIIILIVSAYVLFELLVLFIRTVSEIRIRSFFRTACLLVVCGFGALYLSVWVVTTAAASPTAERLLVEMVGDTHFVRVMGSVTGLGSSYGLFRRMTGIDAAATKDHPVVARPEIEIEISIDKGVTWSPVPWAYKPSPTSRVLPWVAPHQPRLDWQMWFAALGEWRRQPWLVRLATAPLVRPHEAIPRLLPLLHPSAASVLNATAIAAVPPASRLVRAHLYHMKFRPGGPDHGPDHGTDHGTDQHNGIWASKRISTYLPTLSANDPQIISWLNLPPPSTAPTPTLISTILSYLRTQTFPHLPIIPTLWSLTLPPLLSHTLLLLHNPVGLHNCWCL